MGKQFRTAPVLVFFVFCGAVPVIGAETDFVIGHVVAFEGNWTDKKCKCKMEQGHAVWNTSVIVPRSAARNRNKSHLTIRLAATGKLEEFDCAKVDCSDPLDVAARMPKEEPSSRLGAFLRAAMSVVRENLWIHFDSHTHGSDFEMI